jgi:hypothetical protein
MRTHSCALVAIVLAIAPSLAEGAAPYVWAYGYSAAGLSACGTFGPTQQIYDAFPGGGTINVSQPKGVACQVGEDLHELQSPTGEVTAGSTLSVSFGAPPPNAYLGDSSGRAGFGVLGAQANGTYSGPTSSTTVTGSEAFAIFRDGFTVLAPGIDTGTPGTFRAEFTVDGALSTEGRGYSQLVLYYQIDAGPQFLFFREQTDSYGGQNVYLNGAYVTMPSQAPDLTILPGSISGSVEAVFDTPFTFGVPFDMTMSLFASALPLSSEGLLGPSEAHTDFLATATLSRITILRNGVEVASFGIDSASDTYYDRDGVHPAPEPSPAALALASAGALLATGRRARRNRRLG